LRLVLLEYRGERGCLRNIQLLEAEGALRDLLEPRTLELDGVIGREIVDADDLVAAREQPPRAVHADEAGDPGDNDFHMRKIGTVPIFPPCAARAASRTSCSC